MTGRKSGRRSSMTDHLTPKQREIVDEAWTAHNLGEDIPSICERLGQCHGIAPREMARLVVNLVVVERQLELIDRGEPMFTDADGRPVIRLPVIEQRKRR